MDRHIKDLVNIRSSKLMDILLAVLKELFQNLEDHAIYNFLIEGTS